MKGTFGLVGGIRFDYNIMIWNLISYTDTYDLVNHEFVTETRGKIGFPAYELTCLVGFHHYGRTCFEASSLVINANTLSLNATGLKISNSITV